MRNIEIYSTGIVHSSVCVKKGITIYEIETTVNNLLPTGISSKWKVSTEDFADGTPNPSPCETDKDRQHYLMVC
jgi:hypothetical protein